MDKKTARLLGFTEHKFQTFKTARVKTREMKRKYGYTPDVLEVSKKGQKPFFVVVQPHDLVRIDKRR